MIAMLLVVIPAVAASKALDKIYQICICLTREAFFEYVMRIFVPMMK